MEDNKNVTRSIRTRYIIAGVTLLIFIILLFSIDAIVTRIITLFLPGLDSYIIYAWEASNALIGVIGSYIIYRILLSVVEIRAARKQDPASGEVLKLVLRVCFSFIGISIILTCFGVSLSGALAGGAVGGVVIGLAAQTVTTSILSGFLVSSSRTLVPGDIALLKSSYWSSIDILVKITHVSTLYTDGVTQNGNVIKFPNPLLLNYTVLTHLKKKDGPYIYPLQVSVNSDLPAAQLEKKVRAKMASGFTGKHLPIPEIVFLSKGPAGMPVNTYSVLIHFEDITQINELVTIVNNAFDEAYWAARDSKK